VRGEWNSEGHGADGSGEGVEEVMSRLADETGECWDVEYQRCLGCGSLGPTNVCGQ
jgi:hypothetical protein